MKVDIYDIQGKHHEVWADDWSEDKGSFRFYVNGWTTVVFNKENIIGIEFKR